MIITLDVLQLDQVARGLAWALLVLGSEDVLAQLRTYIVQIGFRLSLRMKHVANVTVMESSIADWDLFVLERDGGKVKENPIRLFFKTNPQRSSSCKRCITMMIAPFCLSSSLE